MESTLSQTCQYLGTCSDPLVCYNFPHPNNCCTKPKKAHPISLEHQAKCCLSCNQDKCSVYNKDTLVHLPKEIAGRQIVNNRFRILAMVIFTVSMIGIAALVISQFAGRGAANQSQVLASSTWEAFAIPTQESTATPKSTDVPIVLPTKASTAEPTTSPTIQNTKTPTVGPGFSTPVGVDNHYVIYQVQSGDSLYRISTLFNVDINTVSAINASKLGTPLQINQILVIPLDAASDSPIVQLDAVLVAEDTSLGTIAEEYSTTVEELARLNDLGPSDFVPAGRWLIVPVQ